MNNQLIRTNPTASCDRVFVYGTLKEGFRLHGALKGSGMVGRSRIRGYMLYLGEDSYPAVILASKGPWVHGEVYTVNQETIEHLDRIEGVPRLYNRVPIYATNHGPCWIYVWPKERIEGMQANTRIVPDGLFNGMLTKHTPYLRFLNDNPGFSVPDKPHMIWDLNHGMSVIKQDFYIQDSGTPLAIANSYTSKSRETLPPPAPKQEIPDEASQQLTGLEVKFL